jgi:hypothetical protein
MGNNSNERVALNDDEKRQLAEKKVTCPFVGSAVAEDELVVRNSADDPLASIEDIKTWLMRVAAISETCLPCLQPAITPSCGATAESLISTYRTVCSHWSSPGHRVLTLVIVAF